MRAAILACLLLCGCATQQAPKPVAVTTTVCVPLKTWTPAQEAAMADALQALEPANPLVGAMTDYGAMRAADRACLGQIQQ
jgi:hypothetical protein